MNDWVLWNVTGPVWLAMKRFSVFFNKDVRVLILRKIKTNIWPWLLDRVKMALCEKIGRPNLFELSDGTIARLIADDNIRLTEEQILFLQKNGDHYPSSWFDWTLTEQQVANRRRRMAKELPKKKADYLFRIMKDVAVPRFMIIGNSIQPYREDRAKMEREVKIIE